jgi:phosphate:Na+ symporter
MDPRLFALIGPLVGGLGLFLLGMGMMSDGLRLAAGAALQHILGVATRTRWHALGSGMLVTALVQSSSAMTVATIGFVNAGLLGLAPALWVLFGANLGSTMTGWLVAVLGLKFKIDALALPLVGVGVLLRLTGSGRRHGAVGTAVAGFGLLFLGISLLQQAFTGLAGQLSLPQGEGVVSEPRHGRRRGAHCLHSGSACQRRAGDG